MNEAEYLVKLMSAALSKTSAPPVPQGLDKGALLALSVRHGVFSLVFGAQKSAFPEKAYALYLQYLHFDALQAKAAEDILGALDGIAAIPLKGAVLKGLYPQPYMRRMGDIDLLTHREDFEKIRGGMEELGFVLCEKQQNVAVFKKPPFLTVEVHFCLMHDYFKHARHINPGFQWAASDRALSPEGVYIHLCAHLANHFRAAGAGLRSLADFYVYNTRAEFDRAEVYKTLKKLKIEKFISKIEALSRDLFSGNALSEEESELFEFMASSAVHGDAQKKRLGEREGKSLVSSVLAHTFLPAGRLEKEYPVLKKAPFLLPVCWVLRVFAVLFKKRGDFKQYVSSVRNTDADMADRHRKFLSKIGL